MCSVAIRVKNVAKISFALRNCCHFPLCFRNCTMFPFALETVAILPFALSNCCYASFVPKKTLPYFLFISENVTSTVHTNMVRYETSHQVCNAANIVKLGVPYCSQAFDDVPGCGLVFPVHFPHLKVAKERKIYQWIIFWSGLLEWGMVKWRPSPPTHRRTLKTLYLSQNLLSVGFGKIIVEKLANVLMHWWPLLLGCVWPSIRRVDIKVSILYHGVVSAEEKNPSIILFMFVSLLELWG